jgi:hypothetical protein
MVFNRNIFKLQTIDLHIFKTLKILFTFKTQERTSNFWHAT